MKLIPETLINRAFASTLYRITHFSTQLLPCFLFSLFPFPSPFFRQEKPQHQCFQGLGRIWEKEGKKKVWQAALLQQMASMEKEKALGEKRKKLFYPKALHF